MDPREPDSESHRRECGQVVLAEERALPAAGAADEPDRAPEDRDDRESDDQLCQRGEPLARVEERGGAEGQRRELA